MNNLAMLVNMSATSDYNLDSLANNLVRSDYNLARLYYCHYPMHMKAMNYRQKNHSMKNQNSTKNSQNLKNQTKNVLNSYRLATIQQCLEAMHRQLPLD